jgi:branched-chain amino acid transport system permease protein
MLSARRILVGILVLAALALLPVGLSSYWQTVAVLFGINATVLLGYRLITTMGGWSFAQVALMGLGAYTMALMTTSGGWSFWSTLVAGPLVAAFGAALLAFPVLRTRHYYFFLSTAAAAEAVRQCFLQFTDITGGAYGIPFLKRPPIIAGISFASDSNFYYLVLILFVVVFALLFAIDRSDLGRTIKAVAANEELSESLGINTFAHRAFAFVTGSAVAGLGGVLLASFNGIVSPSDFGSTVMFKVVAAAIVGGTSTFLGPIVGLAYLTGLEELFRSAPDVVPFFWGISVIVVVLLTPDGIEGIVGLRRGSSRRFLPWQRKARYANA